MCRILLLRVHIFFILDFVKEYFYFCNVTCAQVQAQSIYEQNVYVLKYIACIVVQEYFIIYAWNRLGKSKHEKL